MTRKPLLQRLDDSVRWTGIPALAAGHPRRRPLRWPATTALVLAIGGFAVLSISPASSAPEPFLIGYTAIMLGFGIAIVTRLLGPLKPYGTMERVDEWDRTMRDRAYAFTYTLTSVTLPALLLLLPGIALLAHWDAGMWNRMIAALGFTLMAVFAALPTAHASWSFAWAEDR